jgi:hypothetical protein
MGRPRKTDNEYIGLIHQTAHLPYRHRQILNAWRLARPRWSFEFDGLVMMVPIYPIRVTTGPGYVHPSKMEAEDMVTFVAQIWREPNGRRRYRVDCEGIYIEEGALP